MSSPGLVLLFRLNNISTHVEFTSASLESYQWCSHLGFVVNVDCWRVSSKLPNRAILIARQRGLRNHPGLAQYKWPQSRGPQTSLAKVIPKMRTQKYLHRQHTPLTPTNGPTSQCRQSLKQRDLPIPRRLLASRREKFLTTAKRLRSGTRRRMKS
jgi:hypothetical protein